MTESQKEKARERSRRHYEKNRDRIRREYAERTPEQIRIAKEKQKIRNDRFYLKNRLALLEKERLKYERESESIRRQRGFYRKINADKIRERQRIAYRKSVRHAIAAFKRGRLSIDELDRRLRESLIRVNERCKRLAGI